MRIVVVHNRYRAAEPSGENRVVDQEAVALEQAGHEVVRYERRSDDIAAFSRVKKATVPASVVWNPFAGRSFSSALGRIQPDIVHTHNLFPLLSPAVLQACHRQRTPVVATFHNFRQLCVSGTFFRSGSPCYECLHRSNLSGVRHGCYRGSALTSTPMALANVVQRSTWRTVPSAYIFISDAQRKLFGHLDLPRSRCFVKWNLVQPGAEPARGENLIAYTGRLTDAKGVRVLMRAWERFETGPQSGRLRLVIAGAGELEGEVRNWASARSSVEFLGLLTKSECRKLVARARAIVAPSAWPEAFGLVVAEAKAAGVPPIAPGHGAFPELITHGSDGLLYRPGDADSLAALFEVAAASPARMAVLGRAAREAARVQFDCRGNVAQLESIYRFALRHPAWREPGEVRDEGAPRSAPGSDRERGSLLPPNLREGVGPTVT